MKVLAQCKFYSIMLLTAVLFMLGTATSDDQTDVSTEERKQMTQKPTIMILGSTHLANPGIDHFNTKMDDVLAPKRQREIEQLVEQLEAFKPTKIAFEIDHLDTETQANYQGYLKGTYELKRWEVDQIGFRLAKQMGHPKVYCVDYWPWPDRNPFFPADFDWDLLDYGKFAKEHNQEHLLGHSLPSEGKITQDENGATWIELRNTYQSLTCTYRITNPKADALTIRHTYAARGSG